MKRRALSVLLTLAMLAGILPTFAFAAETVPMVGDGQAMFNNQQYSSLELAIDAAVQQNADPATIYLGKGTYTLDGKSIEIDGIAYGFALQGYWNKVRNGDERKTNMNIVFVGQGTDKTIWQIGGSDGQKDESFADHNACITFKNMKLKTTDQEYDGFAHCASITVEACVVENLIYYWGQQQAVFKDTIFDVGSSGYALFAYSAINYQFDNCIFNLPKNGRVIRGHRDLSATVTIDFKNNTINSPYGSEGGMIDLDSAGVANNHYIVNFIGTNRITDNKVTPNAITCSEWFSTNTWRTDRRENALWQTQKEFINSYYPTDEEADTLIKSLNTSVTITFEGTPVWQDGRWVNGHDGTYDGHWKTWGYLRHPNHKERIYSSTQTPADIKQTVKNPNDWSQFPQWSADPDTGYNMIDPETGKEYRSWVDWCKYCHHIYDSGKEYKGTSTATGTVTVPKTGDESPVLLWSAMVIASMLGMAALILGKKRAA